MSFRAINWSPNERLSEGKLDTISRNTNWLHKNTPRAVYTLPGGITRAEGIRIVSGKALIPKKPKSDSTNVQVRFNNFFSTSCEPLIATGVVAEHQTRIFCVIRGIGRLNPNYTGFNIDINIAAVKVHDTISRSFYVSYHAVGF